MGRSWKDVKAEKESIDLANGRDVDAARADARDRTDAHILGYRLAELRKRAKLTQQDLAARIGVRRLPGPTEPA
ncbi:hypothetical protein F0L68_03030 [Solihabitans fulvus]|uniref:HTH cro/C1-type domain-containing protein n=1 Tax=Solihabitans fulvus TaxID=1892852 RepID=A0A5B2XR30_9PSEU|nr:hypothetical protein [Solihabitans fulvus]KAA2266107.1 hypothetical protein F0L68_03030 [Solihabitans fulvus]